MVDPGDVTDVLDVVRHVALGASSGPSYTSFFQGETTVTPLGRA